jgi:hypothetical protein
MNPQFHTAQTVGRLVQSERHVQEGQQRVERLRTLVGKMERDGHPTDQAKILLDQFQSALAAQVESRDRLRREAAGKF